jgi:cell wall-associated NlpC family hydrolase
MTPVAVIAEAITWIGTPYHTGARVKGAGADCLTFIACVFEAAGVVPPIAIPHYPADWHLHRDEERYLNGVLDHCVETVEPPIGGIALWQIGRCYSHGAIIIEWPRIIHAYIGRPCCLDDADRNHALAYLKLSTIPRPRRFFRPRAWA